jgi:outer membrane protein assembly factor BamB
VANGIVYIASDQFYAFDAITGASLWTAPARRPESLRSAAPSSNRHAPFSFNFSSPAVANGVVYFGSVDGSTYAFDAIAGAPLWNAATGAAITASPTVADGMVFVGSDDNNLYAYALDGGNNAIYKNRHTLPPSYASLHPDYRLKPSR